MRASLPLAALLLLPATDALAQLQIESPRPRAALPLEEEGKDVEPPAAAARIACLDDAGPDGAERKGVQKRTFLKRMRFEISAIGGFVAGDVVSSTYTYGGALAFFPSEDFGLEAAATVMPVDFKLEEPYTGFDRRQRFSPGNALQVVAGVALTPFHAKFKFTETNIVHGDLVLAAGAGQTFHESVQGMTFYGGVGIRLYLAKNLAIRVDFRDHVVGQEVVGRGRVGHNISILMGLSLWVG